MIEALTSESANDPLAESIGNRCPWRRLDHGKPHVFNGLVEALGENRASIVDQPLEFVLPWQNFTKLLNSPIRIGMTRHVDVKEPSALDMHHDEDVKDLKPQGCYGTEIARQDVLAVILQKRGP